MRSITMFNLLKALAVAAALVLPGSAFAQTFPTSGATPYSAIIPANTTGVLVRTGKRIVASVQLSQVGSTAMWIKFYDTSVAPTCGSGTPIKRMLLPAAPTAANGSGSNITLPVAINFKLGIGYCVTGLLADADTTNPAAGVATINLDWF
jgi:hypothetical protein